MSKKTKAISHILSQKTFPKLMVKLLDGVNVGANQELFPPLFAHRDLIKRLAGYCRQTKVFKTSTEALEKIREYTAEKADTPQDRAMVLWSSLYATHSLVTAYLTLPLLDEYLDQVGQ